MNSSNIYNKTTTASIRYKTIKSIQHQTQQVLDYEASRV